jgi:hypothetical protein
MGTWCGARTCRPHLLGVKNVVLCFLILYTLKMEVTFWSCAPNKQGVLSTLLHRTEFSVMKTAYRPSWCSWRTSSNRMVTATGRPTEPSIIAGISVNWTSPTQPSSCPLSGLYLTVSAECWPDTTSNLWACPTWNYTVSSVLRLPRPPGVYRFPLIAGGSTLGRQAAPWT